MYSIVHDTNTIYTEFSMDLYVCNIVEGKSKGVLWFIFADHQVEYIVSLSHYFFLRMLSEQCKLWWELVQLVNYVIHQISIIMGLYLIICEYFWF